MSPLDDQLRAMLHTQADVLAPSPDPLADIERRARGIRRRRVGTAMAGAALAVAAVAFAVPSLTGGPSTPQFAGTPTATSTPPSPLTWAYRGNAIPRATLDAFTSAWVITYPGSTLKPLFGQVYEPSANQELVFLADGPEGVRVGVVKSSPSGPEFVYDELLGTSRELAFVLPGDEVARVLVVAAPDSRAIAYRDDTQLPSVALTPLAPGVATGPVAAERSNALVSVTRADGAIDELAPAETQSWPANVLNWQPRGDISVRPPLAEVKAAFAHANGDPVGRSVVFRTLFAGDTDSGVRFIVGQAWFNGDSRADTMSYATGGTNGPAFRSYGFTPESPSAIVALLKDLPGTSVDFLVVVPTPRTGQVSYAAAATGSFRPVTGQDHLDGVVMIDRAKTASADRLEILDGNGDLDKPLYRGPVTTLLCEADCPYAAH